MNCFLDLGFRDVIGAIDGTQIQIQRPRVRDYWTFRNRKGRMAINVQVYRG